MQEPNPMQGQGFPFNGHQHPTFGGPGMQLQGKNLMYITIVLAFV